MVFQAKKEVFVNIHIQMTTQEANDLLCTMRQYLGGKYRGEAESRELYYAIKDALGDDFAT